MAVTVKISDKDKTQVAGPPPDLSDYVVAGEQSEGTKAFLLWALPLLVLAAGLTFSPATRTFGIVLLVWWITTCLIYFVLAPRTALRRLRMHGSEYAITSRNQPRLKNLLSKASSRLGLREPESFLVAEPNPQVSILGGVKAPFIVITQGAVDLLQPVELDTLILRCLVHARQGHVRRLTLLRFMTDTAPALRLLVWPAGFYAYLLRLNWQDLSEQTSDRLTLLLMKNYDVLLSALLKLHAATDPQMQTIKVTAQDVDSYIKQRGVIGLEGKEISTQYRLGSSIHDNSYLEERIRSLTEFHDSDEFDAALDKLAAARVSKTSLLDPVTGQATPVAPKPASGA